jgi:hypothetical protein
MLFQKNINRSGEVNGPEVVRVLHKPRNRPVITQA